MSIRPRKNEDIAKTIPESDAPRNDAAAESKPSAAAAGGGVGLCPRGRGEGTRAACESLHNPDHVFSIISGLSQKL